MKAQKNIHEDCSPLRGTYIGFHAVLLRGSEKPEFPSNPYEIRVEYFAQGSVNVRTLLCSCTARLLPKPCSIYPDFLAKDVMVLRQLLGGAAASSQWALGAVSARSLMMGFWVQGLGLLV